PPSLCYPLSLHDALPIYFDPMARGAVLGWLKMTATSWNFTSSPIWRFFQTPKGLLIIVLALLVTFAAPREGVALVAPGLVTAVRDRKSTRLNSSHLVISY